MSFSALKKASKRFSFEAFEIVLDKNDPALDATFVLQSDSYGTPKTTDNILAYTGVDFRSYLYANQQLFGVDHFVGIDLKIETNAPKIDPGKTIGFRATGTVSLKDFSDFDEYSLPPPYDDRRTYGSHFKKLFARNHLKNRRAKIYRGYSPFDFSESNCQVENYIIDDYTQPDRNGNVTFSLVDELILVESKKAIAPVISAGSLSADITNLGATLTFNTTITDEYGAISSTGFIAVEKEVMFYTVTSATTMNVTRAQLGTEAKAHKLGDTLQKVLAYTNINIIDVIIDLIENYTKIPASYIPYSDWATLKANDLALYTLNNYIVKPTEVKKLLNELIALAGLSMYVDVIKKQLVIVTVPDFASPVITFNEDEHIIQDSIRVKRVSKEQITRQSIHWSKASATESEREENYTKHFQVIDTTVEVDADESVIAENKPLLTSWLTNTNADNLLAVAYAQRNISRFSKVPVEITFKVDQRYIDTLDSGKTMWLGSIFNVITNEIVDGGLNPVETTFQCIRIRQASENQQWEITGLSYIAASPPQADLYINSDKTDYLLTDELTTTEAREYTVVIGSGVTIDTTSTSNYSFRQGTFFAGATLKLINLGRICGAGGNGGIGGAASPNGVTCATTQPANGLAGGDALEITTDVIIDNTFGFIGGGGGGESGLLAACLGVSPNFYAQGGDGGGGGQGSIGGTGGAGGTGGGAGDQGGDAGGSGTIAAPAGGGGEFGEAGQSHGTATGGAAGRAIITNGNSVTIIGGNNSEQIRGAIV